EGRFMAFLPQQEVGRALEILGEGARWIGSVSDDEAGLVTLQSAIGATRVLDMLSGEQLPRIC
ncbi:hydrogenase expression/formation protein HypE, partial [Anaerolineae bacterium CFX9]|nr:hydrogenase expression/formation protein HypE [Anaerolineae bacterium CFX9]